MPAPGPILITGTTGQVGGAIARLLPNALTPGRAELDLTSADSIRSYLRQHQPRWILNPAAYTAVDKAESEPELAHAINAQAPGVLGEEAARFGAKVLHFSTDYVFQGTKPSAYVETDPTGPQGVYGATKLAGEQALAASRADHVIFRTSWVYAPTGKNFLLTILRLAAERPRLTIVADQHGAPTTASELARLTLHVVNQTPGVTGIYHATGAGETTWHGFAAEIVRLRAAAQPGWTPPTVDPIPTSAFPTPARRPENSRLDCGKLARDLDFRFPDWRDSLADVMMQVHV